MARGWMGASDIFRSAANGHGEKVNVAVSQVAEIVALLRKPGLAAAAAHATVVPATYAEARPQFS
jgi:hypothetical protein